MPDIQTLYTYLPSLKIKQQTKCFSTLPQGYVASEENFYSQNLYQRINQNGNNRFLVDCPQCGRQFQVEPPPSGE